MTIDCAIRFENNPQGIFYVGQTLTGSATLQVAKAETVNGVSIRIEGFTLVQWTERRPPQGHRRRFRQFNGREEYLNSVTYVAGSGQGETVQLPQGTHIYNFSWPLPDSMPTSFEGPYGHIRYTITVVVERPSQQNTTYREAFTVLRNVNLNDEPALRNPKKLELSKQFGWWIFKSDPLDIVVEIPATGYVPGQNIPVTVKWSNNSNAFIHGVRIKLFKNVTYSAADPYEKTKTDSQGIVKVENRDMHKQGNVTFERKLLIPSVPPTSVSPLISIAYELVVYVHVSSGDNPEFKVPIKIGTIPLIALPPTARGGDGGGGPGGDDSDQPPSYPRRPIGFDVGGMASDSSEKKAGSSTDSQTMGPSTSSSAETPMQANDLPPPTYEEAMSTISTNHPDEEEGEAESEDRQETLQQADSKPFIPRYPVYNFDGPGSSKN